MDNFEKRIVIYWLGGVGGVVLSEGKSLLGSRPDFWVYALVGTSLVIYTLVLIRLTNFQINTAPRRFFPLILIVLVHLSYLFQSITIGALFFVMGLLLFLPIALLTVRLLRR